MLWGAFSPCVFATGAQYWTASSSHHPLSLCLCPPVLLHCFHTPVTLPSAGKIGFCLSVLQLFWYIGATLKEWVLSDDVALKRCSERRTISEMVLWKWAVTQLHGWSSVTQQMSLAGKGKINFLWISVVLAIFILSEEGRPNCYKSWVLFSCSIQIVVIFPFLLRSVPCWMQCWAPAWSHLCWQWTHGASLPGKMLLYKDPVHSVVEHNLQFAWERFL